jgi:hypothetical protein
MAVRNGSTSAGQADGRLRDRGAVWGFERRQGNAAQELTAAAAGIRDANPGRFVVIVVGSSSSAIHRMGHAVEPIGAAPNLSEQGRAGTG